MSPPGLVPFSLALLVTISSSSANISCSSSRGVNGSALTLAVLEALAGQVALEAADGDVLQRLGVEQRAAGEPPRVDHLQQRGERLGMAVVRGRREEQAVLALVGELAHRDRALRVHGVTAAAGDRRRARRRDVVGLVDDRGCRTRTACPVFGLVACAYTSRSSRCARTCGSQAMLHDHPREHQERVGVQAVGAAHLGHQLAVDDGELAGRTCRASRPATSATGSAGTRSPRCGPGGAAAAPG